MDSKFLSLVFQMTGKDIKKITIQSSSELLYYFFKPLLYIFLSVFEAWDQFLQVLLGKQNPMCVMKYLSNKKFLWDFCLLEHPMQVPILWMTCEKDKSSPLNKRPSL